MVTTEDNRDTINTMTSNWLRGSREVAANAAEVLMDRISDVNCKLDLGKMDQAEAWDLVYVACQAALLLIHDQD
jgi:hypothetical protein